MIFKISIINTNNIVKSIIECLVSCYFSHPNSSFFRCTIGPIYTVYKMQYTVEYFTTRQN